MALLLKCFVHGCFHCSYLVDVTWLEDIQEIVDGIISDLGALESPIVGFFEDVEQLKQSRHPEASDFYQQYVFFFQHSFLFCILFFHICNFSLTLCCSSSLCSNVFLAKIFN